MSASSEEAVAAMLLAAQHILQEAQQASSTEPDRILALQAKFDTQWSVVHAAATALDEGEAHETMSDSTSHEALELIEQRSKLQAALDERNRTLKEQIDQLRQSLCAVQLMSSE
jgi:hypothetical protein